MPFLTSRNRAGALGAHRACSAPCWAWARGLGGWVPPGVLLGPHTRPSGGGSGPHRSPRSPVPLGRPVGPHRPPSPAITLLIPEEGSEPLSLRALQLVRGSMSIGAFRCFIPVSVHPHGGGEPWTTSPGTSRCGRQGGSSEPQHLKGQPKADGPALTPLHAGTLDGCAALG